MGEHEGEGGMTVGNGDEIWVKCSGELSGSHVIARRCALYNPLAALRVPLMA